MTLQKAMRVRSEMKKQMGKLNDLLKKVPYAISFKNEVPDEKNYLKKERKNCLPWMECLTQSVFFTHS